MKRVQTVWTTPQWVASVWMGTNDTGATDSDPTGGGAAGNNMVQITANQWDGGSAGGDGNLTQKRIKEENELKRTRFVLDVSQEEEQGGHY